MTRWTLHEHWVHKRIEIRSSNVTRPWADIARVRFCIKAYRELNHKDELRAPLSDYSLPKVTILTRHTREPEIKYTIDHIRKSSNTITTHHSFSYT
jgi:hypothetical protein